MQAIMETIFDIIYLATVITMGIIMVRKSNSSADTKLYRQFGVMAIILGFGDAFHLVPRSYALFTTGMEANAAALGVGKLITSITMTIFYVMLYHIWRGRYHVKGRKTLTYAIYGLAIARIVLCLFPQNEWLSYNAPLSWGIYRNIPFVILGIIIIYIFYKEIKKKKDIGFKYMPLAIILSFAFYIPVVLLSDVLPIIGMLMIPKTIAYVWMVYMGFREMKAAIANKV